MIASAAFPSARKVGGPGRRVRSLRGVVLAAAIVAGGCGKGSAAAPPNPSSQTVDAKALIAAWQKAGLAVEGFGPVDATPYAAASCMGGRVSGIDATVCTYKDDASLAAGQKAADRAIGDALVGLPAVRGHTLLVLVDHARTDPGGAASKTVDTMAKVFANL